MTRQKSLYSYRGFSSVGLLTPYGIFTTQNTVPRFDSFIDALLSSFAKKHGIEVESFVLSFPNLAGSGLGYMEPEPDGKTRIRRPPTFDYSPMLKGL